MLPSRARIYLDANILIHILGAHPQNVAHIETLIGMIERTLVILSTSELTIAEVLVKPLSDGNDQQRAEFERMFSSPELSVLPVTRTILVAAAKLRGQLRIKLPDAIHVASAVAFEATHFLTEDLGIRTPDGMQLVRLADLAGKGPAGREASAP